MEEVKTGLNFNAECDLKGKSPSKHIVWITGIFKYKLPKEDGGFFFFFFLTSFKETQCLK